MTDLRQWKAGNHEFRFAAKAELNRLVAAGSSHAAYIIQDNSPHLELIKDVAPTLSGYKRELFSSKADAIAWLNRSGFKLSLVSKEFDEQEN